MVAKTKGIKVAVPITYLATLDPDFVDQETEKGITVQDILADIKKSGINSLFVHDFDITHVGNLIGGKG